MAMGDNSTTPVNPSPDQQPNWPQTAADFMAAAACVKWLSALAACSQPAMLLFIHVWARLMENPCSCNAMPDALHVHLYPSDIKNLTRKQFRTAKNTLEKLGLITTVKNPNHTVLTLTHINTQKSPDPSNTRAAGRAAENSEKSNSQTTEQQTLTDISTTISTTPKGRCEGRWMTQNFNVIQDFSSLYPPKGRWEGRWKGRWMPFYSQPESCSEQDTCNDIHNNIHNDKGRCKGRCKGRWPVFDAPYTYSFTTLIATLSLDHYFMYSPPINTPPPLTPTDPEKNPHPSSTPKIDPTTHPETQPQTASQPNSQEPTPPKSSQPTQQQQELFATGNPPTHTPPPTPPPTDPEQQTTTQSTADQQMQIIEAIYAAYPRKVGKPAALKAIKKALKRFPSQWLLDKTKQFATLWENVPKNQRDFCPHPATWFNQERFNDAPENWNKPKPNQIQPPNNPNNPIHDW